MAAGDKVHLIDPGVTKPDPRELVRKEDRVSKEEDEATELAFAIACEDPTERDHLARTVSRAKSRVKAAAVELVRALLALCFAWLARSFLNLSYRKFTARRGAVGRAERNVLALQRRLGGLLFGKILGKRNLLRMLGASRRENEYGNVTHSLGLSERRYRVGEGARGFGNYGLAESTATDAPIVRVLLGVRIDNRGELLWCLKRFVRRETGTWSPLCSGYAENAETIVTNFYMEPSLDEFSTTRLEETPSESEKLGAAA